MENKGAFGMALRRGKRQSGQGELLLYATFGRGRLTAHWLDGLGVKLSPYHIDYGFTGGDLDLRLSNCRAPRKDRMGPNAIPIASSEKVTTTNEAAGSRTSRNKGGVSASTKDGIGLNGEGSEERTQGEKSGASREFNHARALLHISGPDDRPCWRFETEIRDECLSGHAPGSGAPPLAILAFDAFPAGIEATFSVLANDVRIIETNPGRIDKDWVPRAAVAKRALKRYLANNFFRSGGSVIVERKTLGWIDT